MVCLYPPALSESMGKPHRFAFALLGGLVFAPAVAPSRAQAAEPEANVEARLSALEEDNRRLRARVDELEQRARDNARLREKVDKLEEDTGWLDAQLAGLLPLKGRFGGYLDFGFFHAQGDGSGVRSDIGHRYLPEYDYLTDSWVFYGDPLSTMVNGRGEPADTGESRALTFDSMDSQGKTSFVANALNMGIFAAVREDLTMTASIDFVPRGRDVSIKGETPALGDFLDVKLAYLEYLVPIEAFELSLYAGKIDSVLGWEYRNRESPDRLTVTPSLLCRYTCGAPLGLKARARLWDGAIILNGAVTNGSHATETFPIHNEIDRNQWKTLAGRVASRAPLGAGLEVGLSGSIGAQDLQAHEDALHTHAGVDLHLDWHDIELTAEFMFGELDGRTGPPTKQADEDVPTTKPCNEAPCLDYRGAYALVGYRALNWLTPYARVDWRDALHRNGTDFVYVSQVLRGTFGARIELGPHVVLKAEYNLNRELTRSTRSQAPVPQIPNDVVTSSMVLKY